MLWFPQPSRAPVPCPTLAAGSVQSTPVQTPAGVGFYVIHDSFRTPLLPRRGECGWFAHARPAASTAVVGTAPKWPITPPRDGFHPSDRVAGPFSGDPP